MFELDYLTQRLTFTRLGRRPSEDDRGLRPDLQRRGRGAAGRQRRAARLPSWMRSSRSSATAATPVDQRGRRALGGRDRQRTAPGRQGRPAGRSHDALRRGWPPNDDHDAAQPQRSEPPRAARSTSPSTPASTGEPRLRSRRGRASPGTVGSVALVGAGKMGLPLAAQFAEPRLAGHRGRRQRGGRGRDQRRAARTWPRNPDWSRRSPRPTPPGRLRATTDGTAAARAVESWS